MAQFMKYEWRKKEKNLYLPEQKPLQIRVPAFSFFTISGKGNPNSDFFSKHIEVLYSLSYTLKMLPKNGFIPDQFYDFTVYPLEGVWDISEEAKRNFAGNIDKNELVYDLMIRQPDFITDDLAETVFEIIKKKKPNKLLENVKFRTIEEGDCVQMLHLGSYDSEQCSFDKMEEFCRKNNLVRVSKIHREIYLSDTRKVAPEKLKTVLRFGVKKNKSREKGQS